MAIKKVLFICSVYKPNFGGVEISIAQISKHLRIRGIDSIILTKRFPKTLPIFDVIDNVPVYRIERPVSDSDFNFTLADILKNKPKLKADIVHIIGIRRPMPLFGLLLAKKWNIPYLVTFAGEDLPQSNSPESQKLWQEGLTTVKDTIPQADDWATFAKHTSDLALKVFKDIKRPKVIYGGVDLKSIKDAKVIFSESPYFFTARRLEYSKGINVLIRAFAKVSLKLNEYELVIAGDGTEREILEKLATSLFIKVKFLGTIDQTTVFQYMKGAVAHICPSRTESGGLVNYEAQAAGCIAIGSNIDGIPEYITNNRTGLLFESENAEDLSKKLLMAASNDLQIQRIRKIALDESKKHDWDTFTDIYLNLYQNLLNNHHLTKFMPWSELTKSLWQQINS